MSAREVLARCADRPRLRSAVAAWAGGTYAAGAAFTVYAWSIDTAGRAWLYLIAAMLLALSAGRCCLIAYREGRL